MKKKSKKNTKPLLEKIKELTILILLLGIIISFLGFMLSMNYLMLVITFVLVIIIIFIPAPLDKNFLKTKEKSSSKSSDNYFSNTLE